eukprot:2945758-Amphidinium_carterae.1
MSLDCRWLRRVDLHTTNILETCSIYANLATLLTATENYLQVPIVLKVDDIFREVDENGDGNISFEEFMAMMKEPCGSHRAHGHVYKDVSAPSVCC